MEQLVAPGRPRTCLESAREQPQGYPSFILWKRQSGTSLPEKVLRTQMWGKVDPKTRAPAAANGGGNGESNRQLQSLTDRRVGHREQNCNFSGHRGSAAG